ncbi:unnamed protein product [Amoebophrya sp. A25]|nr:unnamed protein product [Amoebophrya sp. A25]|eukprot:GSA25T00006066001.1
MICRRWVSWCIRRYTTSCYKLTMWQIDFLFFNRAPIEKN